MRQIDKHPLLAQLQPAVFGFCPLQRLGQVIEVHLYLGEFIAIASLNIQPLMKFTQPHLPDGSGNLLQRSGDPPGCPNTVD